jgi:hypothetical protein
LGSYSYRAVYGFDSPTPLDLAKGLIVSAKSSALDGARYLESGRDVLTCWDVV